MPQPPVGEMAGTLDSNPKNSPPPFDAHHIPSENNNAEKQDPRTPDGFSDGGAATNEGDANP